MDKVRLRAYAVGGAMILLGLSFAATKRAPVAPKTENWLIQQAPEKVDGVAYDPGAEPGISYRMDKTTYETLTPYGIVSRTYGTPKGRFDAVLIASNSKNSFHDPRVCFSGSGFVIEDQQAVSIPTKTRGDVPATFVRLTGPQGARLALFTYRADRKFVADTRGIKLALLKYELFNDRSTDGVFYRFIATDSNSTKEDLLKFAGDYLDAAGQSSKDYY